MSEAIQLDLFHGIVLSKDQLKKVENTIVRQNKDAINRELDYLAIEKLLNEAGFVKGTDYTGEYIIKQVTYKQKFGYSYDNSEWEHEITVDRFVGDISLLVNKIVDGKIVSLKSGVSREGNKLRNSTVTDQWRYYLPTSLFKKLKAYNENIVDRLKHVIKQNEGLNKMVTNYKNQYPNATVSIYKGSRKRTYADFNYVEIKFPSGSWVRFELGYGYDWEKVIFNSKYDACAETNSELLERFNKQTPN